MGKRRGAPIGDIIEMADRPLREDHLIHLTLKLFFVLINFNGCGVYRLRAVLNCHPDTMPVAEGF